MDKIISTLPFYPHSSHITYEKMIEIYDTLQPEYTKKINEINEKQKQNLKLHYDNLRIFWPKMKSYCFHDYVLMTNEYEMKEDPEVVVMFQPIRMMDVNRYVFKEFMKCIDKHTNLEAVKQEIDKKTYELTRDNEFCLQRCMVAEKHWVNPTHTDFDKAIIENKLKKCFRSCLDKYYDSLFYLQSENEQKLNKITENLIKKFKQK